MCTKGKGVDGGRGGGSGGWEGGGARTGAGYNVTNSGRLAETCMWGREGGGGGSLVVDAWSVR